MNPSETVIVIRSLVPGGVAQQDGRLIPGDRLLFVNSTSLENASLDRAVQALKGAGRGVVRIGVAKPLPLPEAAAGGGASTPTSQVSEQQERRALPEPPPLPPTPMPRTSPPRPFAPSPPLPPPPGAPTTTTTTHVSHAEMWLAVDDAVAAANAALTKSESF